MTNKMINKKTNRIIKKITIVLVLLIITTPIQAQYLIGSDFGIYSPEKPVYDYQYKDPFAEPQKPELKLPSGFDKSFDAVNLRSFQDADDGWLELPYGNPGNALRLPVDDGFGIIMLLLMIYLIAVYYRKRKKTYNVTCKV